MTKKRIVSLVLALALSMSLMCVATAATTVESSPTGNPEDITNVILFDAQSAAENELAVASDAGVTETILTDSPTNGEGRIDHVMVVDLDVMPLGNYTDIEVPANTAVFFTSEYLTSIAMSVEYMPTNLDLYYGIGTKSDGTGNHWANRATGGIGSVVITPGTTKSYYPYLANGNSKVMYVDFSYYSVASIEVEPAEAGSPVDLTGMEVGDVVYVGDIAIKRVADDEEGPIPPVTRTITDGFSVPSFGGARSNTQWLSLNSTYKYWYMWINNTSNNTISVTIGNNEATQSANYYTVDKGKYDIWSTTAWPAEELRVSFGNGSGMYGSATGVLCSTLDEALDHLH